MTDFKKKHIFVIETDYDYNANLINPATAKIYDYRNSNKWKNLP